MATQSGTLKAGYQLYIDIQNGDSSTVFDYTVTGASVRDNGKAWKSDRVIGPFAEDVSFSVTYTGSPLIYKVQPNGQREYTADTLPASLPAGTSVVVDGSLLVSSMGGPVPIRANASSFAVIGDSFTMQGYNKTDTVERYNSKGWLTHALYLCGFRIKINGIFAAGGTGITSAFSGTTSFSDQLTQAIATKAKNLFVMGGINDALQDVDPQTAIDAYVALVKRAVSAGMRVFVITQPNFSSGYTNYTAARQAAHMRIQSGIRDWCMIQSPINVICIDAAYTGIDPVSTTASWKSGYSYDNLHPKNNAAYFISKPVASVINQLFPPARGMLNSNVDNTVFNAASTNLLANGLMVNSSSGVASGFFTATENSGSISGASVVSRSDGFGNNQSLPITFTAANDSGGLATASNITGYNDGDGVYAECEVTLSAETYVKNVRLQLQINGTVTKYAYFNFNDNSNDVVIGDGNLTYPLRTPIVTYDAAAQGASTGCQAKVYITGAGAGTVTALIGRFQIRRVPKSMMA